MYAVNGEVGVIAFNASTEYHDDNGGGAATNYPIDPLIAGANGK